MTTTEKPSFSSASSRSGFCFLPESHHPVPHTPPKSQLPTSGRFFELCRALPPGFKIRARAQRNNRRQFHLCRRSGFSDLRNSRAKIACPTAVLFKRFHRIKLLRIRPATSRCHRMHHDDDYDAAFCSLPDAKTKRRIKVTRDHPVPLPVALVRGNACHKTGSLLLWLSAHVTNRTSERRSDNQGFHRCRPHGASPTDGHHAP